MEFWLSTDRPAPERKRKNVTNALESHEAYLKLKNMVLSGRMRPMQSAILTMGPDDAKALDYKWPWRSAVDSMRRLLKSMHMESEYVLRKWETNSPGIWAVQVTYEPPMTAAQPHAEPARQSNLRRGRPRKTA